MQMDARVPLFCMVWFVGVGIDKQMLGSMQQLKAIKTKENALWLHSTPSVGWVLNDGIPAGVHSSTHNTLQWDPGR